MWLIKFILKNCFNKKFPIKFLQKSKLFKPRIINQGSRTRCSATILWDLWFGKFCVGKFRCLVGWALLHRKSFCDHWGGLRCFYSVCRDWIDRFNNDQLVLHFVWRNPTLPWVADSAVKTSFNIYQRFSF